MIHKSDYFEQIKHRHNLVLMGDSLGDLHMADGACCHHVLKIGFLNHHVGVVVVYGMDWGLVLVGWSVVGVYELDWGVVLVGVWFGCFVVGV